MRHTVISATLAVCLVLTGFLTIQGIRHVQQMHPIQDVVYVGHKEQMNQWLATNPSMDKDQLLISGAENEDMMSQVIRSQFHHSLIMTISSAVLLLVQLLLTLQIWLERRKAEN